jgi:recombination protein RecA
MMTLSAVVPAASLTRPEPEVLESALGGIPRGALTEIAGFGRTAFLYSLLAAASAGEEFCAVIDAENAFDPVSAAAAGVCLSQVLWVRCGGNVEHAIKVADLLVQAGGFGMVAIDLGDTPVNVVQRIPLAAWFRLRQAIGNTKTILVSLAQCIHARSCSALKIEFGRERVLWRGRLLEGVRVTARCERNHRVQQIRLTMWRTHSCVPCRDSSRHLLTHDLNPSACATSAIGR